MTYICVCDLAHTGTIIKFLRRSNELEKNSAKLVSFSEPENISLLEVHRLVPLNLLAMVPKHSAVISLHLMYFPSNDMPIRQCSQYSDELFLAFGSGNNKLNQNLFTTAF